MRPSHCLSFSLTLATLWLAASASVAQSQSPTIQQLLAPDGEKDDFFGGSVAVDGNWLVVGALGDDDADPDAGALYVYSRSGGPWALAQKVYAQDGTYESTGDSLGTSVALHGNLIASGAPHDTNPAGVEAGSVFLFANQGGTWVQVKRLDSLDSPAYGYFGRQVALSDKVLVVTAMQSAFVFELEGSTWVQTAKLLPADGEDWGGPLPTACSDDTILFGNTYDNTLGLHAGTVLVFEKVGGVWHETARLDPPDPKPDGEFGVSLALDGSRAVVGAPRCNSAVVFERGPSGWTYAATLTPNEYGQPYPYFGSAVALDGDRATVGDSGDSHGDILYSGGLYDFALLSGTWTHVDHILPPDPIPYANLGVVLSLSGLDLLAGVPSGDPHLELPGAAYVIHLDSPIQFLDLGFALAGVDGPPQLSATGTPLAGKLVQVALTHGKPLALGALVLGASQAYVPLQGGMLVPSPDAIVPVPTDAFGTGGLAGAWPAGIPSGAIISLQWWTADAAAVKDFAASNAIGILEP